MFESSLHRDRVETVAHVASASDHLKALLLQLFFEDRRYGKHASSCLSESSQESIVLKFSGDDWPNAVSFQPEVEVIADGGVLRRHEQRGLMEGAREIACQASAWFRSG